MVAAGEGSEQRLQRSDHQQQRQQRAESMDGAALSVEQKRALFRDGFVHLKGVIPHEITSAARNAIEQAERDPQPADGSVRPTGNRKTDAVRQIGAQEVATDTVNRSPITPILTEVMGEFQAPTHCQVAYTPVSNQPVRWVLSTASATSAFAR